MKRLLERIREILRNRHNRRAWARIISAIACLVVFFSTYALILPAITMEKNAYCGIEAHQHDDSCYSEELICTIPESEGHTHDDSCYTTHDELSCQLEEHVHGESCYDEEGNLICELIEHEHDSSCWQEVTELTCGLEESEGHHHTDACYEKVKTCGKEAHTHSEACYKLNGPEAAGIAATDARGVVIGGDNSGKPADDKTAEVDVSTVGETDPNAATDSAAVGLTTGAAADPDTYVPTLDELDFNRILNRNTGIYYYHVETAEDAAENQGDAENIGEENKNQGNDQAGEQAKSHPEEVNSADIPADAWQKVNKKTVLGENDILRVYFSYTIPAGSLNETNDIARYRLPANLHISDDQIKAINKTENGIAAAFIDYDTLAITDADAYHKYLGVEAVEGTRRPGEIPAEDVQEYISAVVRVENIYDTEGLYGKKDALLGQDLVFTFVPYTVQTNQNTYDAQGDPTSAGQAVKGWFTMDLTPDQIDFRPVSVDASSDSVDLSSAAREAEIVFVEEYKDPAQGISIDEISTKLVLEDKSGKDSGEQDGIAEDADDPENAENPEQAENADRADDPDKDGADQEAAAKDDAEKDTDIKSEKDTDQETAPDKDADATEADASDQDKADYPAQSFQESIIVRMGSLSTDTNAGNVANASAGTESAAAPDIQDRTELTVSVEAEEGTFPEGTTMHLATVTGSDLETVAEAVEGAVESRTAGFHAVDITFRDADGKEIEPRKPIKVSMQSESIRQAVGNPSTAPVVVHVEDNKKENKGKNQKDNITGNGDDNKDGSEADRKDEITSEADSSSNLGLDSATVTGTTVPGSAEEDNLTFEADSFSVYAIVYTVDFHWEVDGKVYDFSIPGGGFVSLEHIVEALGIAATGEETAEKTADKTAHEDEKGFENDSEGTGEEKDVSATYEEAVGINDAAVSEATKSFVANVESVEFSNPELVWTGKAEKETTVGKIKEEHGLDVQYSFELPDELIAEMDSHELASEDWVLISILPFDTTETLTVTMSNGEVWEIAVTDVNANARKASLIPASGIRNNENLVIYQKVVQPDDSVLYCAIDGNGNLQRVYNSSDSVYWLNDPPIVWKVVALSDGAGTGTGYYTLYNEATGNYLVPKADGGSYQVVHKLSDFPDGDQKHLQVSLPGKEAGQYSSKIASWDYAANVTYGMEVLSITDIHAKELLSSQEFMFATPDEIVQGRLSTVDTVDSLSKGIKITMFDFTGNEWQKNPEPRLSYMTRIIGDSSYAEGVYHPGLVKPVLGSDGFPVSTATGQSIRPVFQTQGNYYSNSGNSWSTPGTFNYTVSQTDNVNHLFLQSVYDATGYFYYSCFENYAHLNGSNFEVYEQLGTPWDGDEFFFQRGNFTPYNTLDLTHIKANTTGTSSSSPLGDDDPRKGEDLYVINGDADYYFGMIMEADFIQGLNGYNDRDEPTVYEFNGDDDLWIYIDNVLVLDIGGVHDAFQGRIDFATGDVTITNGTSTTIRQMFWNARVFPDGTPWDDSRVNEYFEGNTFKDYSTHSFKMFYMERGAAASNLEMKFNLMPVQGSSFRVTKQMPETASGDVLQNEYADAIFYYRAYTGNQVCTRSAFGSTAKYSDGTPVIWKDENTFQLKHGQTAIFPVDSNTVRYYVEEVEPEPGSTMLNHYDVTNSDPESGQQEGKETRSSEKSVKQRGEVVFANRPDDSIVNELRIVKNLTGGMYTDDQGNLLVNEETGSPYFEYRVYLENTAGKMVYYSLGEYYQTDINGKYVYYENGERKTAEYRNGKYIYTYNNGTVEQLDKPKITEHTSQNGTIGDIRHGDTIVIRGLLEGTDFVVDERTDRSLMIKGTPGEDTMEKYSFDGTEVEDAYIRATGENRPAYLTGTLYDSPAAPSAPYSHKAAEGTIIQEKDARVTVKNSSQLIDADLSLKKVSENSEPLEGAVFKLVRGQEIIPVALSGEEVVIEPLVAGETVTIRENTFKVPAGGVKIKNITASKTGYKLIEVSSPDGYVIKQPEVAEFKSWGGDVEITSDANFTDDLAITFDEELNVLTVPNQAGVALPHTGGPGTRLFTIIGNILILGAGLLLWRRRRFI